MDFNWKSPLVTRVSILIVTIVIFSYGLGDFNWFISLALLGATAFQVAQLVKAVEKSLRYFS